MKKKDQQFYLVDLKILPEAIKKTIRVKEMLQDGTCGSINAFETEKDKIVVLFLVMSDDFAVFNRVLRRIVKDRNEIISLNRGIPAEKLVAVTITIKTEESLSYLQYLQETIKEMKGIQSLIFEARGELT